MDRPVARSPAVRSESVGLAFAAALALHAALVAGLPFAIDGARGPSPADAPKGVAVRLMAARTPLLEAGASTEVEPGKPPAMTLDRPQPAPEARPPRRRRAEATVGIGAAAGGRTAEQDSAASPAALPASPRAVRPDPALPPAPDYRSAWLLDPGPRPLGDVDPEYPADAGMREGAVILRLLIGADGAVDDVRVVQSSPPGVFEASAVAAFAAARFSPGMLLGIPVKSQITIEVRFTPVDRGAKVGAPAY